MRVFSWRVMIYFGLMLILFFLWRMWIYPFIKLEEMRLPYEMIFFLLLTNTSLLISRKGHRRMALIKEVLIGGLLGHALSFVSLIAANFFIKNGIERNLESFQRVGFFHSIIPDFFWAFVMGGWFLGILSVLLLRRLEV